MTNDEANHSVIAAPPVFRLAPRGSLKRFFAASPNGSKAPTEPFRGHVVAGKFGAFYGAHTYHTKVPPEGIEPFIRHYTSPGDVVLDPFCGSGMTGVAALTARRRAVLSDLSPAAAFIAYHHCSTVDADRFLRAAESVLAHTAERIGPLYRSRCSQCGADAEIAMTVWGERYRCRGCGRLISQWRHTLDESLRVRKRITCPHCRRPLRKGKLTKGTSEPVLIHLDCPHCGRREQEPTKEDRAMLRRSAQDGRLRGLWYPRDPIRADTDEIKRVFRDGVRRVDQLFTRRNLLALATLYDEIGRVRPLALRRKLLFAFTASIPRTSRTNKYIPHLHMAPGPIVGTMYLPGFYPELNVLKHFARKANDVAKAMRALPDGLQARRSLRVQVCSATRLANVPDQSIDYVFTDPPFGSNIHYSDLNFVWESWLGQKTDRAEEAVVSRAQGKSASAYGDLMRQSFEEIGRVLKPGRWMTLVFHNTAAEVWSALLSALAAARLTPEAIYTFDKKQESFKQVTAAGAVGFDVVMHCRRSDGAGRQALALPAARREEVERFVRKALAKCPPNETPRRRERRLYSEALVHFIGRGQRLDMDFDRFRQLAQKTRGS